MQYLARFVGDKGKKRASLSGVGQENMSVVFLAHFQLLVTPNASYRVYTREVASHVSGFDTEFCIWPSLSNFEIMITFPSKLVRVVNILLFDTNPFQF